MKNAFVRFIKEEDGIEMLEWAVVAALFVGGGALIWGDLSDAVDTSLGLRETELVNAQ
jgi:Flp pilus assembly pilin Flp